MEFSHLENDTVYLKGTDKDKNNLLTLIFAAKDSFNTGTYASVEPETIEQLNINSSGDTLALSKEDLNATFAVLCAMRAIYFDTEKLNISEEKFVELKESIDNIHLIVFRAA